MPKTNLIRRNLSGIYIFDTFPSDEKQTPTCIEDCQQRTRRDWCVTKTSEYLKKVIDILSDRYKELCEYLCEEGDINSVIKKSLIELITIRTSIDRKDIRGLIDTIDYLSEKITSLADSFGVRKE